MKFSVYQTSRKGGREKNEDRMGYCYTRESALFTLADGMGGHADGEVAAQIALQTMSSLYQNQAQPAIVQPEKFLTKALLAAHHQILYHSFENNMPESPRTTLVAALMQESGLTWIHCGDSRIYWVRGSALVQRSRDHSYAEHKNLSISQSAQAMNRNVLFTCLGSPVKPIYDISDTVHLEQGDKLLLCSDGLWGAVEEAEIVRQLSTKDVEHAVLDLVELALKRGGAYADNVTVIAVEWETPDSPDSVHALSTRSLGEGAFASTIQSEFFDKMMEDFDEAAIERSIEEINKAIERTQPKKNAPNTRPPSRS